MQLLTHRYIHRHGTPFGVDTRKFKRKNEVSIFFMFLPLFGRRRVLNGQFCKLYDKYFLKIIFRNFSGDLMVRNRLEAILNQRACVAQNSQKKTFKFHN